MIILVTERNVVSVTESERARRKLLVCAATGYAHSQQRLWLVPSSIEWLFIIIGNAVTKAFSMGAAPVSLKA